MNLFSAMLSSDRYSSKAEICEVIRNMKLRVVDGEDPEEVLFEEGFEPDYIFDII